MSDFTFYRLKYERPDYDRIEEECNKMAEEFKNAKSYSNIKAALERGERLMMCRLELLWMNSSILCMKSGFDT